jgi:hypothetical protein
MLSPEICIALDAAEEAIFALSLLWIGGVTGDTESTREGLFECDVGSWGDPLVSDVSRLAAFARISLKEPWRSLMAGMEAHWDRRTECQ